MRAWLCVYGRHEWDWPCDSAPPLDYAALVDHLCALSRSIDTACDQIKLAERKIDIVCMSAGGMPFQGAVYTAEGLETSFPVSYYSRLWLLANLLPLLGRSSSPRVLSILNGTKEKRIKEDDVGLDKSWGIISLVNHSTLLTSLGFEYLAVSDSEKKITFIHDTPGFVNTRTPRTSYPSRKNGWLRWVFLTLIQKVSGWLMIIFGMFVKESGERHAYYLTSDTYRPGSWRADKYNELKPDSGVLEDHKSRGWSEKAWEHTQVIWDKASATGGGNVSTGV